MIDTDIKKVELTTADLAKRFDDLNKVLFLSLINFIQLEI